MRHVARAANVSVSTVSKALRNDPSISKDRRDAIQKTAEKMAYRPHPMVAALMSRMHQLRRRTDPCNIAWIDLWPREKKKGELLSNALLFSGAAARAGELGYGLEIHYAGRDRIPPETLCRLLVARSQWGLIIPPAPEPGMRFPIPLKGLAGVNIGTSLQEPVMHRVSPNHFQGCVLAWNELKARGYRRIGIALSPEMNKRVAGKWLGAFLACQESLPRRERTEPHVASPHDQAALTRWWRREKPDSVLLSEKFPWETALVSSGGAPDRPAIAGLLHHAVPGTIGGIDCRPEALGRTAVDMVVAQIHRNERGSPAIPQTILIDALWTPNPTQ